MIKIALALPSLALSLFHQRHELVAGVRDMAHDLAEAQR